MLAADVRMRLMWCACLQGDRKTSIRAYLAKHPDIMDEQPPDSLKERYNG